MAALAVRGKRTGGREGQSEKTAKANVVSAQDDGIPVSGVEKYLKHQKALEEGSGVAKYIENLDKSVATGVTKYLRRQAVADKRQAAQRPPLSGVDKYLKNRKPPPAVTGVAKYIKRLEQSPLSGVSKYVAKQAVAAKQTAPKAKIPTGVSKYLQSQAQSEATRVAKYVARLTIAERQAIVAKQSVAKIETGVERYLHQRGN